MFSERENYLRFIVILYQYKSFMNECHYDVVTIRVRTCMYYIVKYLTTCNRVILCIICLYFHPLIKETLLY